MKARKFFFLINGALSFFPLVLLSQQPDSTRLDSVQRAVVLEGVTVSAFQSRVSWIAMPAAVSILNAPEMQRYSGVSLVPVLNTVPGIRMEERSPASYRLSIRGSLLRSPFGVRNVKVYWNEIPLSDGSGNTYLNLLSIDQLSSAEIIKGPAASRYGAGTGGVLLLKTELPNSLKKVNSFSSGLMGGSYGLFSEGVSWKYSSHKFSSLLQQSHLQGDGYRIQSASRRDVVQWQSALQGKHQEFRLLVLYASLFYQTPGGITLEQMNTNPRLARQPAGNFPGAVQQQTAINNTTLLAGLQHTFTFSDQWALKSFVLASTTDFANPFITNYEKRKEDNVGAGATLVYRKKMGVNSIQWLNGAEWLYNHSVISNYGNRSGVVDTVQFTDNVFANQWSAYSQLQWLINNRWNLAAGISFNNQLYQYKRLTDPGSVYVLKDVRGVFTPRLAILYKLTKALSLYSVAAKGFSPPSLAEVRPSDGNFYADLQAEYGWNFETGIKGESANGRLQFDLAAYFFTLRNAIVRRNNSAGAEYFVNAGEVRQNGWEAMLKYELLKKTGLFLSGWKLWSSYSCQPFYFTDYRQTNFTYTGNRVTGVPRNIWVFGSDIATQKGFYLNASLNATSAIPLTDANDVFAADYQLLQVKLGRKRIDEMRKGYEVFVGGDNLLNQLYSLGNDINAAGKRYYNPAAQRNFFLGCNLHF